MIHVGHVITELRKMPAKSVHCAVTSPPYWSMRDYSTPPQIWGGNPNCQHEWAIAGQFRKGGPEKRTTAYPNRDNSGRNSARNIKCGQNCMHCEAWLGELGHEPTPELFVAHLVEVFSELRRVLRDDGSLWINIGDTYCNDAKGPRATEKSGLTGPDYNNVTAPPGMQKVWRNSALGLKRKDLVGLPWMLAFALRAAGWWLRSEVIWHKRNPVPESSLDRPCRTHEQLFMFSKSAKYFYDPVAVMVAASPNTKPRGNGDNPKSRTPRNGNEMKVGRNHAQHAAAMSGQVTHRHLRTVWTLSSRKFSGNHFAAFPPELVEPCIRAGTSERGCCPSCGAPWKRLTKKIEVATRPEAKSTNHSSPNGHSPHAGHRGSALVKRDPKRHKTELVTIGWRAACSCDAGEPIPCRVLDPFIGSGTTGLMASYLGREWLGIDVSEEYADMARLRIAAGYTPPKLRKPRRKKHRLQRELFV